MKKILLISGIIIFIASVYFFLSGDKGLQIFGFSIFLGVYLFLRGKACEIKAPKRKKPRTGWYHIPHFGDSRVDLS